MCERGTETIVETPEWAWAMRNSPEIGICIDSCIAKEIVIAWDLGLQTLGSCCGHGKEAPSIVLTTDLTQVDLARTLLPGYTLYQWRLTDVTGNGQRDWPSEKSL